MKFLALITIVFSTLIEYNFKNSVGQVVSDLSGNSYYAVLGQTLLKESSDPLPTDRGLYFSSTSLLTLPPNALKPQLKIPFDNLYMQLFVYLISTGRILTFSVSGTQKITIDLATSTTINAYQYVSTSTSVSLTLSSGFVNTWIDIGFVYKFISSGVCTDINMKLYIGSLKNGVTTGTSLSLSTTYNVQIGDYSTYPGFTGFMSDFYVFKPSECVSAALIFTYATYPTANPDPYTSSSGTSCSCSSYSCTGNPVSCIQCDSSCKEYCTTSSSCLSVINICKPYAIIDGVCDTGVLYINNCQTQASSTVCLECDTGYSLSFDSSTCCLDGYYMVSSQVCAGCDSSCSTCDGSTKYDCLSCVDTTKTVTSDGSCGCLLGTDPNTGSCIGCLSECLSCNTADTCTECNDLNAEVNQTGRCQCKSGYYDDPNVAGISCQACDQSCSSCSGSGQNSCIGCSDPNAYLASGLCVCNPMYYKNTVSGLCEICNDDCANCASGTSSGCTECKDLNAELVVNPGACSCKTQYFASSASPLVCSNCHSTCETCSGSTILNCNSCKDTMATLASNQCICNQGYYYNESYVCTPCHQNCFECTNSTQDSCLSCKYQSMTLSNSACICKQGYYTTSTDPLTCEACHANCETCSGPSITDCLTCITPNSSLVGNTCKCISGYYQNNADPLECLPCNQNCLECTSSTEDSCLSCKSANAMFDGTSCICESGYFASSINPLVCQACHANCQTCSGPSNTECLTCKPQNSSLIGSACECDSGFFESSTDPLNCLPCHQYCLECTDSTEYSCLSCKSSNMTLNGTECICQVGYGPTGSETLTCVACHDNCETCSGPEITDCLTCKSPNSILIGNSCKCSSGFFQNSSDPLTCLSCHESCENCSGSTENSCLSCKYPNTELVSGKCKCVKGFYWNETLDKCDECQIDCSVCSGFLTCDSCGKFCDKCQSDSVCLECAQGTFIGQNFDCVQCDSSCDSCISSDPSGCITCSNPEIKLANSSGKCSCEEGEFISNFDPLQCSSCLDGCMKCSESECFECGSGYSLINGNCDRNKLALELEVFENNTILLYFSEPLLEDLKTNQITCKIGGIKYAYTLQKKSSEVYEINIDYSLFPTQKVEAFITFYGAIQSQSFSLLQKLNYNCTLTKPAPIPFQLSAFLSGLSSVMKFSTLASGVSSMFFSNHQGSVWVTFNTIQTLSYLPLFNIDIPDFLKFFFIGVRPITIFPNPWDYFNLLTCDTPEIAPRFYSYGFTCKNFLYNCGEFMLIFTGGIGILVLWGILTVFPCRRFNMLVHRGLHKFRYSFFLRFWIQSYTELMLATVIGLNFVRNIQLTLDNTIDIINSTCAFVVAIILLSSPLYLPIFYKLNNHELEDNNQIFFKRYSPLFDDFNLSSRFKIYLPIFFITKIMLCFILYSLRNPYSQVIISIFIQMLNIFIMIRHKIMKEKSAYVMYIFEEFVILCEFFLLFQFLFGFSQATLKYVSFAMIGIAGIGVGVGSISSFVDIYAKIKEYRMKKKAEKKKVPVINVVADQSEIICTKNKGKQRKLDIDWIQVVPYNSNINSPMGSICEDKAFMS